MENFILLPSKAQKRSSGFNQYAEESPESKSFHRSKHYGD